MKEGGEHRRKEEARKSKTRQQQGRRGEVFDWSCVPTRNTCVGFLVEFVRRVAKSEQCQCSSSSSSSGSGGGGGGGANSYYYYY
jgi:hypothetical protein